VLGLQLDQLTSRGEGDERSSTKPLVSCQTVIANSAVTRPSRKARVLRPSLGLRLLRP
jgi:hypothetical protein